MLLRQNTKANRGAHERRGGKECIGGHQSPARQGCFPWSAALHIAEKEPDAYLAQVYRFGLLEDFDHLYRYSALMDRLLGKDANTLTQSCTDIVPGRPTSIEHRHPLDDLRKPYDRRAAVPLTKLHAYTPMAGEHQTHDYYMTIGPMFADPTTRQLYAELASIEEQHVTHAEGFVVSNEEQGGAREEPKRRPEAPKGRRRR
jgi:hypothetical protein